ncbi:hypothetical protein [Crenobacter cavernae]|nr:hypothetical protein [Crenobacter cavernae]
MKQAILIGLADVGRGFVRGTLATAAFFGLIWLGDYIAESIKWGHF